VPSTNPNPIAVASTVINTLLGLVGVIAVIVIIYGGFTWLTSAGNEEKVTKAKKLLASAVIGVAIILGAYTITSFVVKSIGEAAKTGSAGYSGDRCTNHPGGTCLDACTGALVPFTQLDCADGKICCANAP
ncbi:MAG: hypothetical protein HY974_03610, partial [Candidatus Kerfeldbacteria bacterium]|nr:hypothetical protein [Candidatus Kerfeldbacteria bacterium]